MDEDALKKDLISNSLLNGIVFFEEIDSTNLYAKSTGLSDNTLVIASHQKKGTGRFGREWEASAGENLTFSLVKNFKINIDEIHLVNFYSAYILYYTLRNMYSAEGLNMNLKWPNDILINNKKAAGILLDVKDLKSDTKRFIIGIGLNVNQKSFSEQISVKATSLYRELEEEQSIEGILVNFIMNFYSNISLLECKEELMDKWRSGTNVKGKKIFFKVVNDSNEIPATVLDIDHDGGLKVLFEDGRESKYYSGEISLKY